MCRVVVDSNICGFACAKTLYVLVLGIAQDGQSVSSIALVSPDTKKRWIFDAIPDLPEQFDL